jgi:nicotinate-nucleotide pyrophosphorylase (carboxylating)
MAVAAGASEPRSGLDREAGDLERVVAAALAEDVGSGDVTTEATVAPDAVGTAVLVTRAPGVVAGLDAVEAVFRALDPDVRVERHAADGDALPGPAPVATVSGSLRALLTGERTALNLLGRLSGIATLTRSYVDAVAGTGVAILDTRKTTPGLRLLEKYAVRCGGGINHRLGLYDAILIKDNHIAVAGGVGPAIRAARAAAGRSVKIEVEVDDPAQLDAALAAGPDIIMLDNMDPARMRQAVAKIAGRAIVEASGNVTLESVRAIAETGVDLISSGWITHSAPALDIALDVEVG